MPEDRTRHGLTIDAMHEGNVARFLNHSCAPNLDKQVIFTARGANSLLHYVGFIATQPGGIPAGTELTYDYKWHAGAGEAMQCTCGAPQCCKIVGEHAAAGAPAGAGGA